MAKLHNILYIIIIRTLLYRGHLGSLLSLSLLPFKCKLEVIIDCGSAFVTPVERGPVSRPRLIGTVACVAGAKGEGGGEKGKREGSACSKSLCFCITPTNFLVIRLRLLSIKCRYSRHCRKTLHSRTKEMRLIIEIQKALWRILEPLFSRNKKKLYASKEVKEIALASEGKSCRPENNNYGQSICMS